MFLIVFWTNEHCMILIMMPAEMVERRFYNYTSCFLDESSDRCRIHSYNSVNIHKKISSTFIERTHIWQTVLYNKLAKKIGDGLAKSTNSTKSQTAISYLKIRKKTSILLIFFSYIHRFLSIYTSTATKKQTNKQKTQI